jgi:hypothetical protein
MRACERMRGWERVIGESAESDDVVVIYEVDAKNVIAYEEQ